MHLQFLRASPLVLVWALLLSHKPIYADSQGRLALIDLVIQEFSTRLGLTQEVSFALVVGNDSLVSVQRAAPDADLFVLSFEEDFLRTLDDRDICAAIAHELGHVWIYTHFPYLHTESLANEYALRLVPQEDLDGVYEKVRLWKRHGVRTALP